MRKQKGFTLVELVVVVMILGILAAVAAPKLLGTSAAASDNGLKQSLAVVRDAIERYAAEHNGSLPPGTNEAAFKAALADYLRGGFPVCPVALQDDSVKITTTDVDIAGTGTPAESWHYCSANGQFICNSNAVTKITTDDSALTYDKL